MNSTAQLADAGVAGPRPSPWLDLLGRHARVLRAAWAARAELAGPQRLADERAFLPAALALQETPPHPAPQRAALAICALFALAVGWACVGEIDVVAVAHGRLVVHEHSKVVQPLEAAVVRAIHVRDGDRVAAGQLLVELDATAPNADAAGLDEQRRHARNEQMRAEALLRDIGASVSKAAGDDKARHAGSLLARVSDDASTAADPQLAAQRDDIHARLARHDADIVCREAELATATALRAKLAATLPLAQQRERDIQALSAQGFVAQHAGQDRSRERVELERDLSTAEARVDEAQASLAEGRQARTAYLAELRRTLQERAAKSRLDLAQLDQAGRKAEQRAHQTRLTAPVAGTVQQLAVHTAGGVVTPAQALLVIVPEDAPLIAEVEIDNKDIGFVQAGQRAEIKLETFNFTRYGTVPGTVEWVAADAVARGPSTVVADRPGSAAGQAVFPARVRLEQGDLLVDGRRVRLGAGLNVTAELRTGKRRVIDYLLSPVQRQLDESLGER